MSRVAGSHKPRQSVQSWGRLGRLLGRSALPRHDCGWEAWAGTRETCSGQFPLVACYPDQLPSWHPPCSCAKYAIALRLVSPSDVCCRQYFYDNRDFIARGAERRRRVAARCGCGVGFVIMTAIKSDFWTERSAVQHNSSPDFRARDRIIRREAKTVKMVKFIVITHRLPII